MKDYNRENISIDSQDDNENYDGFSKFLEEDTNLKKEFLLKNIAQNGELLINEIEKKKRNKEPLKKKYIAYILKHSDKFDDEELISYSFEDVRIIYLEIKSDKNLFKKIIKLFV